MTNYKTTIGGAFSVLGTTLIGVGVVPQLSGVPNPMLTKLAIAGFFCSAAGKFLSALFAADAKALKAVEEQTNAIAQQTNVNTVQIADAKNAIESKLNA